MKDGDIISQITFDGAGLPTKCFVFPTSQRLFAKDEKVYEFASQFFRKYFITFDSENRQLLFTMYDENALFSITGWK
jgi:hypothetical protein